MLVSILMKSPSPLSVLAKRSTAATVSRFFATKLNPEEKQAAMDGLSKDGGPFNWQDVSRKSASCISAINYK